MKYLSDYFDRICCVSYVESQNRRDSIESQFKSLHLINDTRDITYSYGMPLRNINALDKESLYKLALSSGMASNIASVSCALAHYMAIKAAYESGAKSVLVFEDDLSCIKNREVILDYLDNIPDDWDFLYFTPSFVKESANVDDIRKFKNSEDKFINIKEFTTGYLHWNPFYNNVSTWISAACYALNRTAMLSYIVMFESNGIIVNADTLEYFFHNTSQQSFKSYVTNRRLFAQMQELDALLYNEETDTYEFLPEEENGVIPNDPRVTSLNFYKIAMPSIIADEFIEAEETTKSKSEKEHEDL